MNKPNVLDLMLNKAKAKDEGREPDVEEAREDAEAACAKCGHPCPVCNKEDGESEDDSY